jgi:hypothetical protein
MTGARRARCGTGSHVGLRRERATGLRGGNLRVERRDHVGGDTASPRSLDLGGALTLGGTLLALELGMLRHGSSLSDGCSDGPSSRTGRHQVRGVSGSANARSSWALGALLDLELDLLTAHEAIEVEGRVDAAPMEEILLRIIGGNEAEAAIGDDLLDGSARHGC